MRGFLLGIAFTLIVLVAGGWWCVKQGYVDFAADQKPSIVEDKVAMAAVDASTDRRAGDAKNPLEATEVNIASGAQLYLDHCAGCHFFAGARLSLDQHREVGGGDLLQNAEYLAHLHGHADDI